MVMSCGFAPKTSCNGGTCLAVQSSGLWGVIQPVYDISRRDINCRCASHAGKAERGQDGAEIAELTGIYLLKEADEYLSSLGEKSYAGLYRDDGLIYPENANGSLISKIEKALYRIFKRYQLKIAKEQKGHTVNFLDVTLSTDGSHKPYMKPNSSLKYVNKASNHPPSIPKNIPSSVQKRLTTISKEVFNEAKSDYEGALGDAGYSEQLAYDNDNHSKLHSTRKRRRRIVWYNPPYSKSVATNIGQEFFKLLQLH